MFASTSYRRRIRLRRAGALSAAFAATLLAGCGSGGHASTTTTSRSAAAAAPAPASSPPRKASIGVVTAVRTNQGTVNARYSCRGADVRPSVKWRLPEGDTTTKEILVFIRTISRNEITTDWAAGGIGPKVHELKEGPLPAGVVVARNGFGEVGYHLCPAKNDIVTVGVYAVPHTMSLKQGFAPSSVKPELGSSEVPWGGAVAFQH